MVCCHLSNNPLRCFKLLKCFPVTIFYSFLQWNPPSVSSSPAKIRCVWVWSEASKLGFALHEFSIYEKLHFMISSFKIMPKHSLSFCWGRTLLLFLFVLVLCSLLYQCHLTLLGEVAQVVELSFRPVGLTSKIKFIPLHIASFQLLRHSALEGWQYSGLSPVLLIWS